MKVLFITNQAPHYRILLFNELSKRLNIKFIFTHEDKQIKGLSADYISLKGIGYKKFRIHPRLIKIIKKEKPGKVVMLPPDPLHLIDNFILYKFCKKRKIDFIFFTERWSYFHLSIKDKISNYLHKFFIQRAKKILVSGKKSKEWVLSQGVKESKIIIAPDASEILYDKKEINELKREILKKYKLKNKKIILYVGRLISRKGVNYLISAFSKLKDKNVVLLIVGGGDFYNLGEKSIEFKLKEQVKKLKLEKKIIFVGEINHSDTAAYYSLANVFVMPSITEKISEPWGLTLNEAMQFGLPVIATDAVGAAYDLIKNGKNGFMVKEKNSKELAEAMGKILDNKKLGEKMGKESLRIIKEKNNYKKMTEGFIGAIDSCLRW